MFRKGKQEMLPLYQGMMASLYNHRAADVVHSAKATKRQNQPSYLTEAELADPLRVAMPAYWVDSVNLPEGLPAWFVAFSNVSSPTNERTMVTYALPRAAVGHSIPLILSQCGAPLLAALSSFILDYSLRQKLGGVNLTYNYVQQLPVPSRKVLNDTCPWAADNSLEAWIVHRLGELVYTAIDMRGFAARLWLWGRAISLERHKTRSSACRSGCCVFPPLRH